MDLYVLKDFNNYFNRKVIRLSTLQDYLDAVEEGGYFVVENTNFNPADGISTSHVIGSANHPFDKNWQPDYALLIDWPDGGEPRIVSRWFVTESARLMGNQYTVALKRDSVVDKYDQVVNSPCYIKKGYLASNNPFIVNNEGIQFNQIKTKEYYLKDKSKVAWVVCYLARDRSGLQDKTVEAKYYPDVSGYFDDPSDPNYSELQEIYDYLKYKTSSTTVKYLTNKVRYYGCTHFTRTNSQDERGRRYYYTTNIDGDNYSTILSNVEVVTSSSETRYYNLRHYGQSTFDPIGISDAQAANELLNMLNPAANDVKNDFYNLYSNFRTSQGLKDNRTPDISDELMNKWNNKLIGSRETGRVYRVYFNKQDTVLDFPYPTVDIDGVFRDKLLNHTITNWHVRELNSFRQQITFGIVERIYRLSEQVTEDIQVTIPDTMYQTQESTYDVLAFPIFNTRMTKGNQIYDCVGSAALNIASAMKTQFGDFCYDVQILPYAPFQSLIDEQTNQINLENAYNTQYVLVSTTGSPSKVVSVGIVAPFSHFSFDIDRLGASIYNDEELNIEEELKVTNRKIEANTDMYRLSSPNYASSFEFNLAKMVDINGGSSIKTFNVDCTYRPHNPYIKINPNFSFLYGHDYNDARGLICSGDFGITTMSDAWVNYQIQNKNYQNMFDRQIQNMETNRQIAREQEQWNMGWQIGDLAKGQFFDAAMSGVQGFFSGGPVGGILGTVSAGFNSLYSGAKGISSAAMGMKWSERAFKEQRSFSTDMFNMNLDNIKALPQSITHTSSVSLNFKFYPVLEYYTCTEQEKQALQNKIKWNGMTVGLIGKIVDYLELGQETYIQGDMIRLENTNDDAHLAQDIYEEVNKGLFFENAEQETYNKDGGIEKWVKTTQE